VRNVVLLACLVLAAVIALVLALDPFGGGAPSPDIAPSDATTGQETSEAVLVGQGEVAEAPVEEEPSFADETDLKTLLHQSWSGNAAHRRLLELARADERVLAELVAWLGPERDDDRVPKIVRGQQWRGPAETRQLFALGAVLIDLAPASVPLLVAALSDDDPVMRRRAAEVLGRMGPAARDAVPALLARLGPGPEDARVQVETLYALPTIGGGDSRVAALFLDYLRDDRYPDGARAAAAEGILQVTGPTQEALDACAWALRDQSYEVCTRLIPNVATWGAAAAVLVPELLAIVPDRTADGQVRSLALEALVRIGGADERLGDVLIRMALDEEEEAWMRHDAFAALARMGGDSVQRLLKLLTASDAENLCLAVSTLGEAGGVDAARLLDLLEPLRRSPEWEDRQRALNAAMKVRGEVDVLVPYFQRWVEDDPRWAEEVLGHVSMLDDRSGKVVACLASLLRSGTLWVRISAMGGLLARTGTDSLDEAALRKKAVIDAVRGRLSDPSTEVQYDAALWIARVAPEHDEETLPVWIRTLEKDARWWPDELLVVLRRLGPRANAALPGLESALARTTEPRAREAIQRTIDAIRGT